MGTSQPPYQMVGKKERDSTPRCVLSSIAQSVGSRPYRTPSRIGTVSNKGKEMREIIFRAWDGDKYHYGGFVVHPDGKMEYPEGGWDVHGCDDGDLLEQYTGLTDKNGKKIFEGDIVKCHAIETDETVIVEDIRKIPVQFKWVDIYTGATIKVIGNIHDNPELLEGGTC